MRQTERGAEGALLAREETAPAAFGMVAQTGDVIGHPAPASP